MRGDAVNVGELVIYRGESVQVAYAWRPGYNEPQDGFEEPVGVELLLPVDVTVRIVWPPMGSELDLETSLESLPIESL